MKGYFIYGIIMLAVDFLTKIYVKSHFALGESTAVLGDFFKLTFVRNEGIAFGTFQESGNIFLYLTPIAIIALSLIFLKIKDKNRATRIAFVMIIIGAVGNYIDRVLYGYVVDFFDFDFIDIIINPFQIGGFTFSGYSLTRWPVFNIADSLISIGVGILMFDNIFVNSSKRETKQESRIKGEESSNNASGIV